MKSVAKPLQSRPDPFALRDDLVKGYKQRFSKEIWNQVQFSEYGMPVVLIHKAHSLDNLKPKFCNYSVGINDHLVEHRHPMPLPEELMQKLGGGYGYTKKHLADTYN